MILRALATCFAVILLIAVGWFFLSESEPATPAAPVVEDSLSEEATEAALTVPASSESTPTTRSEPAVEPAEPVQRAPEPATVRLHVMHGITGERLARVRVSMQWGQRQQSLLDSDDQGVVEVQAPAATLFFSANHADLSGGAFYKEGQKQPFELLLFPHHELEIQVIDTNGNPRADVEVCLRTDGALPPAFVTLDPSNPVPPTPTANQELWRGLTAAELGIARVVGISARLDGYFAALRAGRAATLVADLVVPTHPPAAVRIDPMDWPRAPVQLVLPETGALTVLVLDSSGQPTRERATVYVDAALPLERPSLRIGESALENGRARVTGVPYGLPLAVEVSFFGQRDAIRRKIDGPTHAQPDVELVIVETPPMPVVHGRLVGPSGAPTALAAVNVQSLNRAGEVLSFGMYELSLNAGAFEFQLATRLYEGGTVELRFESSGLVAIRKLSSELTHLRIGLGEVQLEPVAKKTPEKSASGGH